MQPRQALSEVSCSISGIFHLLYFRVLAKSYLSCLALEAFTSHRITGSLRLETCKIPKSNPSPLPLCPLTMSPSVTSPPSWNTPRDGDPSAPWATWCHCTTTLLEKKYLLIPNLNTFLI